MPIKQWSNQFRWENKLKNIMGESLRDILFSPKKYSLWRVYKTILSRCFLKMYDKESFSMRILKIV